MSLDLFLRAATPATLRTVVRSRPFRNIIGDVRDPEGSGFVQIPGSVDWVYFAPNSVVIIRAVLDSLGNVTTPAITDPWCWLHLRLSGPAEASDFEENADPQPDRWRKSRIKKWLQANGTRRMIRGARVWEHTLVDGKRIQIWRGSEMESLGLKFHEFMGGNSY